MDTGPISDTSAMIAHMAPKLDETSYAFILIVPEIAPQALGAAIGTFREDEGVTAIVPASLAQELGFDDVPEFSRITLSVHSALEGVGLTAAVARSLADAGIACNMVAAYHHDHAFVPVTDGARALAILEELSRSESG